MKKILQSLKEDSILDFTSRFKKLLEYKLYCINESNYEVEEIAEFFANDEQDSIVKDFLKTKENQQAVYEELKDRDFSKKVLQKFCDKYSITESTDCAYLNTDYGDYKKGAEVEILDSEGSVYKIKFQDGKKDSIIKGLLDFKEKDED